MTRVHVAKVGAEGRTASRGTVAQRSAAKSAFAPRGWGASVEGWPAAAPATAARANRTGLPDRLKDGVEALARRSLDGVRVHYDSARPAQLGALAFAQGREIHLGPGQERHLPHEAWHVVQQAQGRVVPTMQMKSGVEVNDDAGLEREADRMGSRAMTAAAMPPTGRLPGVSGGTQPVQRVKGTPAAKKKAAKPHKLVRKIGHKPKHTKINRKYTSVSRNKDGTFKLKHIARPPSSSRRGQGDHIVAFSLIKAAVDKAVHDKKLGPAAESLRALLGDMSKLVSKSSMNHWWHTSAAAQDAILTAIHSAPAAVDQKELESEFGQAVDTIVSLINQMPGTAQKNKKSTRGHGEGGHIGGLEHSETSLEKGNAPSGNPWVNLLGLIDLTANKAIAKDPGKLGAKLKLAFVLARHAIPITLSQLVLTPPPNTDKMLTEALEGLPKEVAAGIRTVIAAELTALTPWATAFAASKGAGGGHSSSSSSSSLSI